MPYTSPSLCAALTTLQNVILSSEFKLNKNTSLLFFRGLLDCMAHCIQFAASAMAIDRFFFVLIKHHKIQFSRLRKLPTHILQERRKSERRKCFAFMYSLSACEEDDSSSGDFEKLSVHKKSLLLNKSNNFLYNYYSHPFLKRESNCS